MNQLRAAAAAAMLAVLLLAGCTGHGPVMGQVTGKLVSQGGSTPGQRPMAGVVAFTAGQRQVTVRAESSGRFSVQLPPGHYQLSGPCSQSFSVTVTAHRTTHVNVICIVPVSSPPSA